MPWIFRGLGVLVTALLTTVVLASFASIALAHEALYVANANGPSVYQYAVQGDGSLLRAASVTGTAERPDRLVLSPDHRSLYVAQGDTLGVGSLLQYTIQPDGTLTPKEPVEVPTEREIEGIAISPNGSSLYVIEGGFIGDGVVATYAIGPGGSLSATTSPKVSTGDQPFDIAVSPDGESVYVSNWLESTISQYNVQVDGSLAPMTPATIATGPQPYRMLASPDGKSLYVTDEHFIVEPSEAYEGSVSQYTIGTDGSLAPKTPAAVVAGPEPKGISISPGGSNVYVADSTETGQISQFSVDSEGALEPLAPAVGAGRQPFGLAVGLDGKHLYVSNSAEYTIGEYGIEAGGTLRAMPSQTVRAGEWPMSIVLVETEREPTSGREEPQETSPPPEPCHETPPPWRCPEPGPPRQCDQVAPGRCCGPRPGEAEPLYVSTGCCGPGPGEFEPPPAGRCPGGERKPDRQESTAGERREPDYNGPPIGSPGQEAQGGVGGGASSAPAVSASPPRDTNLDLSRNSKLHGSRKATHRVSTTHRKAKGHRKKARKGRKVARKGHKPAAARA